MDRPTGQDGGDDELCTVCGCVFLSNKFYDNFKKLFPPVLCSNFSPTLHMNVFCVCE